MFPLMSINNQAYGHLGNAEIGGDTLLHFTGGVSLPNLSHFFFGFTPPLHLLEVQ